MVGREGGKTRGNGRERRRESWMELSGEKEGKLEGMVKREGGKARGNSWKRRRES
jgi:hypothetical protein